MEFKNYLFLFTIYFIINNCCCLIDNEDEHIKDINTEAEEKPKPATKTSIKPETNPKKDNDKKTTTADTKKYYKPKQEKPVEIEAPHEIPKKNNNKTTAKTAVDTKETASSPITEKGFGVGYEPGKQYDSKEHFLVKDYKKSICH